MSLKNILSNIGRIFSIPYDFCYKARDYDRISIKYTEQINKNMELAGNLGKSNQKIKNLSERIDGLNKDKNFLAQELFEYKKGVLESPEYKELEKEKIRIEGERDGYKKQSEDRGRIIDFQKTHRKQAWGFIHYLINEKSLEPLIGFLDNEKEEPYIFVNSSTNPPRIIAYTDTLKKELDLKESLIGESYYNFVGAKGGFERDKKIKNFLNLKKEEHFDFDYQTEDKRICLHAIKKKPVCFEVSLDFFGKDKEAKVISCIPLFIERLSKWERAVHRQHNLDEVIDRTGEEMELEREAKENSPHIHAQLVKYDEWRHGKILKVMNKKGLVGSYLYLKNELSKIQEREKTMERAKGKREAKIKKYEKKKIRKKRDKVILALKRNYRLKKAELMNNWNESENWGDFIHRCRGLTKEKRELEKEKKEVIYNMIKGVIDYKYKNR